MKHIGGNSIVIKEVNINLVRKTLKKMRQGTKQDIAKATGLTAVTVGTMLQHLIDNNEVFEVELASSRGGRPAQQFRYNNEFALALVLFPYEIDGEIIIRNSVVNLFGESLYEKDDKVEKVDLTVFQEIIDRLLGEYPSVKAIGFGLPGVESQGKMIVSDYKELKDVLIIDHFKGIYNIPVIIENDVNAAAVGFLEEKELSDNTTVIYLYFPDQYPPGAGIFLNGSLYKGRGNFAGEVASMPLDILWNEELYNSFDEFCFAAAKLIVAVSSVLNPEQIVLSGNFLNQSHINKVIEICNEQLPKNIVPNIYLSEKFLCDYQNGLITETLKKLETNIELIIK